MAEERSAQSTGEQPSAGASKTKRKNVIMLGVLVGVMVAEAVVVFVVVKHFAKTANPQDTHAESPGGLNAKEGSKAAPELEVKIGEFRVQNRKGQQAYNVSFSVFATVPPGEKPKEEKGKHEAGESEGAAGSKVKPEDAVVAAKAAKIKDRFTRVIRSLEPECFTEPDLTTLRGKLKEELSEVMGADLKIKEVLLTEFSCAADS